MAWDMSDEPDHRYMPHRQRRSSSVVERVIGNDEVGSSILPCGTIFSDMKTVFCAGADQPVYGSDKQILAMFRTFCI
tara:strand:+ start:8482 stop:8712 length:231 start_codon:yes stop_codon:yes gene_type:complete